MNANSMWPRTLAVIALGLGAVSCGSDGNDGAAATSPATAAATTPGTVVAETSASVAPTTVAGTDSAAATRTIDSAGGPIEIPVAPQRVVLVDYYSLTDLLELGVMPIGAPTDLELGLTPEQLATYATIDKVGAVSELNFETIAGLNPDLIIGVDAYNGDDYATLSAIAPTVLIPFASSGDWPELEATVADALGVSDKLDALRSTYEAASSALAADHAATLQSTKWAIVSTGSNAQGAGTTYVWLSNSTTGEAMKAAGFQLAAASAASSENGFAEVSFEQLEQLADADAIVTLAEADGSVPESTTDLTSLALFKTLPAAQSGFVFPVVQMFPSSYGQATALVGELELALDQVGG